MLITFAMSTLCIMIIAFPVIVNRRPLKYREYAHVVHRLDAALFMDCVHRTAICTRAVQPLIFAVHPHAAFIIMDDVALYYTASRLNLRELCVSFSPFPRRAPVSAATCYTSLRLLELVKNPSQITSQI